MVFVMGFRSEALDENARGIQSKVATEYGPLSIDSRVLRIVPVGMFTQWAEVLAAKERLADMIARDPASTRLRIKVRNVVSFDATVAYDLEDDGSMARMRCDLMSIGVPREEPYFPIVATRMPGIIEPAVSIAQKVGWLNEPLDLDRPAFFAQREDGSWEILEESEPAAA